MNKLCGKNWEKCCFYDSGTKPGCCSRFPKHRFVFYSHQNTHFLILLFWLVQHTTEIYVFLYIMLTTTSLFNSSCSGSFLICHTTAGLRCCRNVNWVYKKKKKKNPEGSGFVSLPEPISVFFSCVSKFCLFLWNSANLI